MEIDDDYPRVDSIQQFFSSWVDQKEEVMLYDFEEIETFLEKFDGGNENKQENSNGFNNMSEEELIQALEQCINNDTVVTDAELKMLLESDANIQMEHISDNIINDILINDIDDFSSILQPENISRVFCDDFSVIQSEDLLNLDTQDYTMENFDNTTSPLIDQNINYGEGNPSLTPKFSIQIPDLSTHSYSSGYNSSTNEISQHDDQMIKRRRRRNTVKQGKKSVSYTSLIHEYTRNNKKIIRFKKNDKFVEVCIEEERLLNRKFVDSKIKINRNGNNVFFDNLYSITYSMLPSEWNPCEDRESFFIVYHIYGCNNDEFKFIPLMGIEQTPILNHRDRSSIVKYVSDERGEGGEKRIIFSRIDDVAVSHRRLTFKLPKCTKNEWHFIYTNLNDGIISTTGSQTLAVIERNTSPEYKFSNEVVGTKMHIECIGDPPAIHNKNVYKREFSLYKYCQRVNQ